PRRSRTETVHARSPAAASPRNSVGAFLPLPGGERVGVRGRERSERDRAVGRRLAFPHTDRQGSATRRLPRPRSVRGSMQEDDVPLCVDLDGTLIHSDLLVESAFALLRRNPFYVFCFIAWLMSGRPRLKHEIAR